MHFPLVRQTLWYVFISHTPAEWLLCHHLCCGFMNVPDSGLHDLSTFSQRSLNSISYEINASSLPRHFMNTCSICSSNNVARSILSLISILKRTAHCALLATIFSLLISIISVNKCVSRMLDVQLRDLATRETEHFLLA